MIQEGVVYVADSTAIWVAGIGGFCTLVATILGFVLSLAQMKRIKGVAVSSSEQLEVIHKATNGSLSRLQLTVEGLREQLLASGVTPKPVILKGATDEPKDNIVVVPLPVDTTIGG